MTTVLFFACFAPFLFFTLEHTGVFEFVRSKLIKVQPNPTPGVTPGDLIDIRNDISKLKIAFQLREAKSGTTTIQRPST